MGYKFLFGTIFMGCAAKPEDIISTKDI